MKYDIQAIPTIYSGVNFRSRLEASWAVFFDQLHWKWEYEPFELNGWFPDFKIQSFRSDSDSLLVEVKPTDFKDKEELNSLCRKIYSAYMGEVLILGSKPGCNEGNLEGVFGMITSGDHAAGYANGEPCLDGAVLNCDLDISAYYGSYQRRFSGHYDGNNDPVDFRDIEHLWKTARNKTQWKKLA